MPTRKPQKRIPKSAFEPMGYVDPEFSPENYPTLEEARLSAMETQPQYPEEQGLIDVSGMFSAPGVSAFSKMLRPALSKVPGLFEKNMAAQAARKQAADAQIRAQMAKHGEDAQKYWQQVNKADRSRWTAPRSSGGTPAHEAGSMTRPMQQTPNSANAGKGFEANYTPDELEIMRQAYKRDTPLW